MFSSLALRILQINYCRSLLGFMQRIPFAIHLQHINHFSLGNDIAFIEPPKRRPNDNDLKNLSNIASAMERRFFWKYIVFDKKR